MLTVRNVLLTFCHLVQFRRSRQECEVTAAGERCGEDGWGRGGGGNLAADLFTPVPLKTLVLFLLPVENRHSIQISARSRVNTVLVWKSVEMLLFFTSHFLSSEVNVEHISSRGQKKTDLFTYLTSADEPRTLPSSHFMTNNTATAERTRGFCQRFIKRLSSDLRHHNLRWSWPHVATTFVRLKVLGNINKLGRDNNRHNT